MSKQTAQEDPRLQRMPYNTGEPVNMTDAQAALDDPQRHLVYAAEEAAQMDAVDFGLLDDCLLTPEQVPQFALDALKKANMFYEGDAAPNFRFDIPDDSWVSGVHEGATGDIRLHPCILNPWTILHELAHWKVGPYIHHGPFFCAVNVRLVRAGIEDDAADMLLGYYHDYGVVVEG